MIGVVMVCYVKSVSPCVWLTLHKAWGGVALRWVLCGCSVTGGHRSTRCALMVVVQSFTSQMTEVFFIEIDNVVGNIDGWRFFFK